MKNNEEYVTKTQKNNKCTNNSYIFTQNAEQKSS